MLSKKDLPKDFDWLNYLLLNPDLKNHGIKTEDGAKAHWLIYGYKENRKYTISNDIDESIKHYFDPKVYRFLHPDLQELTDNQLVQHFINHAYDEERVCTIQQVIPNNFDPRLYKLYNKDLVFLSNHDAIKHYIEHGKKENRIYFCGISYDEIIKNKISYATSINDGSVILINHDISKTGAPIFLYDLYDYIIEHNIFKNVYILEPFPNKILPDNPNKLYHYNDLNILQNILSSTNPALIYSNSINFYFYNIDFFRYWHNKTILHFHEIYSYIEPIIKHITSDISNIKTYVVSEQIKKDFMYHGTFKNIDVFPPFLSKNKQNKIINLSKENLPQFYDYDTDSSRITVGMCGDLSDRKNILLFLRLAEQYPAYNFVWIGGSNLTEVKKNLDPNNTYTIPANFRWVPNTDNPYQYFKNIDYFFLTSKEDPCPIVVLENLLLNKKIIVLKDNIKTRHPPEILENYIELNATTEEDVIREFKKLYLDKLSNYTTNNNKYIENFYTKPQIFQTPKINKPNFLVASLYLDNNILSSSSIDAYINIINQFIIKHQNTHTFYPIIALSSDHHEIYGDKITKYIENSIINIKNGFILRKKNYGYDIAGLVESVKYIFDHFVNLIEPSTYIAYLHNKSNISWKNILHSIFYTNFLEPYDNIVPARFCVEYNQDLDINNFIFNTNQNIFKINNTIKSFNYVQGTTFISRLDYLKPLYENYNLIFNNFTTIEKNDTYWQKIMTDSQIFNKYYIQYSNDLLNSPIDWRSSEMVKKYRIKNYIELYTTYGLKGIPDGQFEHALERYIGYLTLNSNILKV
jgi:hypothetical protein